MRARTNRHARRKKARHQLARDQRCGYRLMTVRYGEITCELVTGHTGHHRWTIPEGQRVASDGRGSCLVSVEPLVPPLVEGVLALRLRKGGEGVQDLYGHITHRL